MTPAILLVTLSLYNQPASNSQTPIRRYGTEYQWPCTSMW